MAAHNTTQPSPLLLTVPDACRRAALSRSRLYRLMDAGEIRAKKLGGRRLIVTESLDAFVDAIPDAPARGGRA